NDTLADSTSHVWEVLAKQQHAENHQNDDFHRAETENRKQAMHRSTPSCQNPNASRIETNAHRTRTNSPFMVSCHAPVVPGSRTVQRCRSAARCLFPETRADPVCLAWSTRTRWTAPWTRASRGRLARAASASCRRAIAP